MHNLDCTPISSNLEYLPLFVSKVIIINGVDTRLIMQYLFSSK
jgi:hypothetical protein